LTVYNSANVATNPKAVANATDGFTAIVCVRHNFHSQCIASATAHGPDEGQSRPLTPEKTAYPMTTASTRPIAVAVQRLRTHFADRPLPIISEVPTTASGKLFAAIPARSASGPPTGTPADKNHTQRDVLCETVDDDGDENRNAVHVGLHDDNVSHPDVEPGPNEEASSSEAEPCGLERWFEQLEREACDERPTRERDGNTAVIRCDGRK